MKSRVFPCCGTSPSTRVSTVTHAHESSPSSTIDPTGHSVSNRRVGTPSRSPPDFCGARLRIRVMTSPSSLVSTTPYCSLPAALKRQYFICPRCCRLILAVPSALREKVHLYGSSLTSKQTSGAHQHLRSAGCKRVRPNFCFMTGAGDSHRGRRWSYYFALPCRTHNNFALQATGTREL